MRIANNVIALNVTNQMNKANSRVAVSMGRLSSGLKINRAKDDAAGYAISTKLDMQSQGYTRGAENAYDGVSLIQTAEGALSSIEELLQRCRELSVQAASDTNTEEDKRIINDEIQEYTQEIDQICRKSTFNGIDFLNGQAQRMCVDADPDFAQIDYASDGLPDGTLSYTIDSIGERATYTSSYTQSMPSSPLSTSGKITINDTIIEFEAGETSSDVYAKILQACDDNNITFDANTNTFYSMEAGSDQAIEISGDSTILSELGLAGGTSTAGTDAVISDIKYTTKADGLVDDSYKPSVTVDGNDIVLISQNNERIEIELQDIDLKTGDYLTNATYPLGSTSSEITNGGQINIQLGGTTDAVLSMYIPKIDTESLKIDYVNASTQQGATDAIDQFDYAIEKVSSARATLGAYENRLDYSADSLNVAFEATQTSLSRIRDTDMAKEMTNYTKDNVIYQAATSILAQANQRPQIILQLIQ